MSTSIHCARFLDEHCAELPFQDIERAFGPYIVEREAAALLLRLGHKDDWPIRLEFSRVEDAVSGFTIERPSTQPALFDALLAVLTREGVVAYAPGSVPVVGHAASSKHLPRDMVHSIGKPLVATSAQELMNGLFLE